MSWSSPPIEAGTVFETHSTDTPGVLTVRGYIPATTVGIAWVDDYATSKYVLHRAYFSGTAGVLRMFSHRDFSADGADYGAYVSEVNPIYAPQYGTTWIWAVGDRPITPSSVEGATGLESDPEDRRFPYILYFDSNDSTGGAYGGLPYSFELLIDGVWDPDSSSTLAPFIWPTHIPTFKYVRGWSYSTAGTALDPVALSNHQDSAGDTAAGIDPTGTFGVAYTQPSVVRLSDYFGQIGWLLILNRARSWSFEHNGSETSPGFEPDGKPDETSNHSLWDIVCYFEPGGGDPTFSTVDTIGPFLLVSGDCRCAVGVEPPADSIAQDLLVWPGTCGGVTVEVDGEMWLYLYYDVALPSSLTYDNVVIDKVTGEVNDIVPTTSPTYTADQQQLLQSKKVSSFGAPDELDSSFHFGKYLAAGDGGICVRRVRVMDLEVLFAEFRSSTEASTWEASWTADSVVPGESLGPIRHWLAVDGYDSPRRMKDFRGHLNAAVDSTGLSAYDQGKFFRVRPCDPEPRLNSTTDLDVDPTIAPLSLFCSVKPIGSTQTVNADGTSSSTAAATTLPLGRGIWQFWAIDEGEFFIVEEFDATSNSSRTSIQNAVFGVDFVVKRFDIDLDGAYMETKARGTRVAPRDLVMASGIEGGTTTTFSAVIDWADSAPQVVPDLPTLGVSATWHVFAAGWKVLKASADTSKPIGVEARVEDEVHASRSWTTCWETEPPLPASSGAILTWDRLSLLHGGGDPFGHVGPRPRPARQRPPFRSARGLRSLVQGRPPRVWPSTLPPAEPAADQLDREPERAPVLPPQPTDS